MVTGTSACRTGLGSGLRVGWGARGLSSRPFWGTGEELYGNEMLSRIFHAAPARQSATFYVRGRGKGCGVQPFLGEAEAWKPRASESGSPPLWGLGPHRGAP